MDTSEQYIKMCEKAKMDLIGGTNEGDYFYEKDYGVRIRWDSGDWRFACRPHSDKWVWLPRQDQLQEIGKDRLIGDNPNDAGLLFLYHARDVFCQAFNCYQNFKSQEQLWLAFVMKEKFKKVWDGEEWVKRVENRLFQGNRE